MHGVGDSELDINYSGVVLEYSGVGGHHAKRKCKRRYD